MKKFIIKLNSAMEEKKLNNLCYDFTKSFSNAKRWGFDCKIVPLTEEFALLTAGNDINEEDVEVLCDKIYITENDFDYKFSLVFKIIDMEINSDYDERFCRDGGSYYQPFITFAFDGALGTISDRGCGDFGSRYDIRFGDKVYSRDDLDNEEFSSFTDEDYILLAALSFCTGYPTFSDKEVKVSRKLSNADNLFDEEAYQEHLEREQEDLAERLLG